LNTPQIINPHFDKTGLIVGIILFTAIFIFVFELEHFQKIIALNTFIFIFSLPMVLLVLLFMSKQNSLILLKEKIAFGLFLTFLLPTITVSIASYVNRAFLKGKNVEQVEITNMEAEFSSMYGVTYDDMMRKVPSHYRIYFNYKDKLYNRSFKKNPCLSELMNETACYIKVNQGALGFDVINLDNK